MPLPHRGSAPPSVRVDSDTEKFHAADEARDWIEVDADGIEARFLRLHERCPTAAKWIENTRPRLRQKLCDERTRNLWDEFRRIRMNGVQVRATAFRVGKIPLLPVEPHLFTRQRARRSNALRRLRRGEICL